MSHKSYQYKFHDEDYEEHRPPVAAAILILGTTFFVLGLAAGTLMAAFGG